MKICHVNLASGFSGGESQTFQLIKQQVKEGYELTVVANPKSPLVHKARELGCKIVLANHFTRQHSRGITDGCRLIHVHEGRAIYWALIQNLLHGTPYIVTRRIDNKLKNKFLSNLAYNKATMLIGLSTEIVHQIQVRHQNKKVAKIPSSPVTYPTDKERIEQIRAKFDNKFLVIHAANLLKHKGFDVTIDAAKMLSANSDIHIALLGDGPEKNTLSSQAEGLTNLSFESRQSDMGNWFAAADLLIHPSYSEGLGSVILEAISSGLPAIASNAGGIPDIIEDQISGLLIEPGDSVDLANKILQVSQNEALRKVLIDGGHKKMKLFDIVHTSKQYRELYEQVNKDLK